MVVVSQWQDVIDDKFYEIPPRWEIVLVIVVPVGNGWALFLGQLTGAMWFWKCACHAGLWFKSNKLKMPGLTTFTIFGLDKKLSNNPERVSINLGAWPMSNEALIAYYLISKQHFNHAKTRVQFDFTIRIVNTREGGGCLDSCTLLLLVPPKSPYTCILFQYQGRDTRDHTH